MHKNNNIIPKEGKLLPGRIKTINKSVLPDRLTPNFDEQKTPSRQKVAKIKEEELLTL